MAAPIVGFLMSPVGQALIGGIVKEGPELVGELFAIWRKKGLVSAEEIADFFVWQSSQAFYDQAAQAAGVPR